MEWFWRTTRDISDNKSLEYNNCHCFKLIEIIDCSEQFNNLDVSTKIDFYPLFSRILVKNDYAILICASIDLGMQYSHRNILIRFTSEKIRGQLVRK